MHVFESACTCVLWKLFICQSACVQIACTSASVCIHARSCVCVCVCVSMSTSQKPYLASDQMVYEGRE